MKKTFIICGAWASGYLIHASYPYVRAMSLTKDDTDQHSFQELVTSHSQPKIIDFFHNSPDKHFLHNLIVQDEKAFNFFKVYLPKDVENQPSEKQILHIVFNAAEELQGNNNDIHSGLLATMIDNAFGQLSFLASGFLPTVTANLQIDYKQAIHMNQDYLITCSVEKVDGRKVYLKAEVFDKDKNLCSSANALFLTVKWGGKQWKQTLDTIQQSRAFSEGIQKILFL